MRSRRGGFAFRAGLVVAVVAVSAGLVYWQVQQPRSAVVSAGDGGIPGVVAREAGGGAGDVGVLPGASAVAVSAPPLSPSAVSPVESATFEQLSVKDVPALPGVSAGTDSGFEVAEPESADVAVVPRLGERYVWHDGDRVLQVWLDQQDLVVLPDSDEIAESDVVARLGDDVVVRGGGSGSTRSTGPKGDPVFWSDTGELMVLSARVALLLDPGWDVARVSAFFADNGIKAADVTELDYVANGFVIETGPGLDSLRLANSLAAQSGVVLASPDWRVSLEAE